MLNLFSKKIGIDLGTANCLVYLEKKGIVLNEPSVVAISVFDKKVVAVGNEAKEMLGRTPGNIIASRPMRDGVIADYVVTEAMLRYFIQKTCGRSLWFKPEVLICIPAGATQVEKRAVEDATISAGAKTVYIIHEPLAAAIGAGIPIGEPSGNMILDVGGGAAECAIISLGGVVVNKSVRIGGNRLDDTLIAWIKKKYGLTIGETTAENTKIKIGSAMKIKNDQTILIKGRDNITGLPKRLEISTNEIVEAFSHNLGQIINMVKKVLEEVPPELSADIIDKGIVMTGGTSNLRNFDKLLSKQTGIPCYVAEDALFCVAKGTGIVLENLDMYKKSLSRR
ncbi:rod shape-determining protein [Candidatus Beckwithbacteria bacterium]|nr:rod shape-determining protein [Candidatus Beckwithbacteria bacterium]